MKKYFLERSERSLPPLAPVSTSDWATTHGYDLYSQMNSIPSQFKKLNLNTTQSLPPNTAYDLLPPCQIIKDHR